MDSGSVGAQVLDSRTLSRLRSARLIGAMRLLPTLVGVVFCTVVWKGEPSRSL